MSAPGRDDRPSAVDLDILAALAGGVTGQQVARQLNVTASAIAMRLLRLRAKVGAATTPELVATALRNGWIA